jgi:hypothetical protein
MAKRKRAPAIDHIKEIPFNKVEQVPAQWLVFDSENPRFTPDKALRGASRASIVSELLQSADLNELIESIANNGYIDIEPLVVMKAASAGKYTVLEGNRRLAALGVLTDSSLAAECGITAPTLSKERAKTLEKISVYRVENREKARAYIGFKHINGPHTWDSLAKARFAATWFKRDKDKGVTLRDIAKKLGDGHATVLRLVQGVRVLDQSINMGLFQIEDRYPGKLFSFSHLYVALTRPGYRKFLGLPLDWQSSDSAETPVPRSRARDLKQLMLWLYGSASEDIPPVIKSQNPDIKRLGEVLENPLARKEMLSSSDLDAAYMEVQTESLQFEQSLLKSYRNAEEAQGKLSSFEGGDETLVHVAQRLRKAAIFIADTMVAVQGRHANVERKASSRSK